jgi:hypothetical protein
MPVGGRKWSINHDRRSFQSDGVVLALLSQLDRQFLEIESRLPTVQPRFANLAYFPLVTAQDSVIVTYQLLPI